MSLLDELLDTTKAALDIASRMKREMSLDERQLDLRAAIAKELLSAMAHSHNLLVNYEFGTEVFVPPQPKPKPLEIPEHEKKRLAHKLQVKLESMKNQLEGLENGEEPQAELFPE